MSAYSENFKLIDWSGFRPMPPKPVEDRKSTGPYFMPDITPFVSPMSGKVLSSRKQVQHEERGYGVRQAGELRHDINNFNSRKPVEVNERALEKAFQVGLEKTGLA
jgi:hypothetical protein